MPVKTIFLSTVLLLLGAFSCFAQIGPVQGAVSQPCRLTPNDSPALHGYKLGMDVSNVKPADIAKRAEYQGEELIKAEYDDSTFYLTFENKKLVIITALFKELKFDNVDAFQEYLDKKLSSPGVWRKQTPEQIEIEKQMPKLEQELATLVALRGLMLQLHGKKCREAKKIEKEIPRILRTKVVLAEKRQIGSRLSCNGFSIVAFIDNSIEKGVPAIHLFSTDVEN